MMSDPIGVSPIPRPAARVILLDARDRLLLFKWKPPNVWITPGGGLEPGETHEQAALRELREETGLSGAELGPWVWSRQSVFEWRNRLYEALERFYLVRVQEHSVSSDGLDPVELVEMTEHRWWSASDIRASAGRESFAPRRLSELLPPLIEGQIPESPIETGT